MKSFFQKYGWLALTFFTFFFLLGSRSLNEPDEGRYAEIAREMVQTGDWLVPHLWYLPHLDKPPMTYWLVAVSMKLFGQNEWAVRLPIALAGISGVFATFLLGCSLGGRRVGIWSALILQSSLLYFVMARFLTTDIFLTQFVAWAIYFFWRSWLSLVGRDSVDLISFEKKQEIRARRSLAPPLGKFFKWHLAGWTFVALGFLTKGPIALAIPAVSFLILLIFRRNEIAKSPLFIGTICGFILFCILTTPWFLAVFQRVPQSAHFMILGQAAGHFLGTTIKNRTGIFFYFFGILAVGLLPWTILLGWLWRKNYWRNLDSKSKDGWLLLSVWAIFTFALFSFSHAKLPAYILPIFPALAVLLAMRFFSDENVVEVLPAAVRQVFIAGALLLPIIFPLLMHSSFHTELPQFMNWQIVIVFLIAAIFLWLSCKWKMQTVAKLSVALVLCGFFITVAEIPKFETDLRRNQTLKPLGLALRENIKTGDALVISRRLPEGLPFYSDDIISATNRPYFAGMNWTQIPFAFPRNRARAGDFILPDDSALQKLFQGGRRVLVISPIGSEEKFQKLNDTKPLRLLAKIGQWELFSNR